MPRYRLSDTIDLQAKAAGWLDYDEQIKNKANGTTTEQIRELVIQFIKRHDLPWGYGEGENSDLLDAYIKGYRDVINNMLKDLEADKI